ncbi:MAG: hypothetical protein ACYC69_16430 [Thermodesulfovibrionales bacterium]
MENKPAAVEAYENERDSIDQYASISMEHPIDRLKYYILKTKGKISKSEFSIDGTAYVVWESQGKQYRAWSTWPDQDSKVTWKLLP